MTIRCKGCNGPHWTIKCPLRANDQRPKSWAEIKVAFEHEKTKRYHCIVPLRPDKDPKVIHRDTVAEFWNDIKDALDHSVYRDFRGIRKVDKSGFEIAVFPFGHELLQEGTYRMVCRTIS
jgi:hypothetical protein